MSKGLEEVLMDRRFYADRRFTPDEFDPKEPLTWRLRGWKKVNIITCHPMKVAVSAGPAFSNRINTPLGYPASKDGTIDNTHRQPNKTMAAQEGPLRGYAGSNSEYK